MKADKAPERGRDKADAQARRGEENRNFSTFVRGDVFTEISLGIGVSETRTG